MCIKAVFLLFICCGVFAGTTYVLEARAVKPTTIAAYDCGDNACSLVAFTWDQERQQFRVQNDSNSQD